MTKLKIIAFALVAVIAVGCLGVIGYNQYYWDYEASKRTTVSTSYVDELVYTPEETYFIEVNYFSNDLKNGEEVFEIRLNYYTDATIPQTKEEYKNVYSSGIQLIGNSKFNTENVWQKNWGFMGLGNTYARETNPTGKYKYYNTTNGISYGAISELGIDNNAWIVDFNGTISLVKQKGLVLDYNNDTRVQYDNLNIMSFISKLYASVKSLKNGYNVLQFDLSKWFTGYMLDETGKGFETTAHAHQNWLFVNCKINRSANGLINASQSIFGMVDGDFNYSLPGQKPQDYWKSNTVYNLTVNDFEFVAYQDSEFLFLGRLKESCIEYLKVFNNMIFYVVIDLDSEYLSAYGIVLVGLTNDPYGSLNVKSTTITASTQTNFILYQPLNVQLFNVTIQQGGTV